MITLKQFFEVTDYKITEGSDFSWLCYGPNAYCIDSWNGVTGKSGYSFSIVFSTKTQKVYEVTVCDYTNNRAYRMIAENKQDKYRKEAESHAVNPNQAWDDVEFVDLEVEADWLEKARAIVYGESYDTRVQIEVDFTDEELLQYMRLAHEKDITFNKFVEDALRHALE